MQCEHYRSKWAGIEVRCKPDKCSNGYKVLFVGTLLIILYEMERLETDHHSSLFVVRRPEVWG
jgi:hypothetical protein